MGLAIGLSISPVIGSLSAIEYVLRDQFKSPLAAGSVHNTDATPGPGTRIVKDTETKLSIVNNTASFLNLATHSWNRQGLYYGPYTRTTGRALAMHFFDSDVQAGVTNTIHLVAGWFISAEPADPTADELCLGIAALVSGSIYLSLRSPIERVRRNTKQVDMFLVAVMRAAGVIYYLTASPNARLLGEVSYPSVMPVGLYNVGTDNLYAGMWATYTQGSAGGSQLRDIAIADIPAWENWYTSASRADTLVGTGDIDGTTDALGNTWSVVNGSVHRSASGAIGNDSGENNYAVITGGNPKGLIAVTVKVNAAVKYPFIVFRYQDFENFFFIYFTATAFLSKRK